MKKICFYSLFYLFLLSSCSDNEGFKISTTNEGQTIDVQTSKMNFNQAELYAKMYSQALTENELPHNAKTRAATEQDKKINNIDFYIENSDTLLYAFNYEDDEGFVLISGDNSSFPILAHSPKGNLHFNNIDKNSSFYFFLTQVKENIKKNIHNPNKTKTEYYEDWKDLGKDGYEYEIEVGDDQPVSKATRTRRKDSSNKASIYPYTGEELVSWCQRGGYNYYAPHQAAIGCPAIAIGMLMYDTSNRMLGNSTSTLPSFGYSDQYDISSITTGTKTAAKLKQIADSIPKYNWGKSVGATSGADPKDIETGLHKLGYKKAQLVPYDFETLYQNLSFKGYNYFGNETTFNRGILIGAYSPYGGGHIWFCDGYYEQSYTVTRKFLGIKVKTWKEYDDRLYMNWGWGKNQGNGWYCATDGVWTSLEGNSDVYYKTQPMMYINLSYYEYPR